MLPLKNLGSSPCHISPTNEELRQQGADSTTDTSSIEEKAEIVMMSALRARVFTEGPFYHSKMAPDFRRRRLSALTGHIDLLTPRGRFRFEAYQRMRRGKIDSYLCELVVETDGSGSFGGDIYH